MCPHGSTKYVLFWFCHACFHIIDVVVNIIYNTWLNFFTCRPSHASGLRNKQDGKQTDVACKKSWSTEERKGTLNNYYCCTVTEPFRYGYTTTIALKRGKGFLCILKNVSYAFQFFFFFTVIAEKITVLFINLFSDVCFFKLLKSWHVNEWLKHSFPFLIEDVIVLLHDFVFIKGFS